MRDLRKAQHIAGYIKLIRFSLKEFDKYAEWYQVCLYSRGGPKTYRKPELIKVLEYNKKLLAEELLKLK